MDDELELQDSLQPDEELDLDLELEPEDGEENQGDTEQMADESVEAYKKRLADVEAKNKQLYARLKKRDEKPAEKPKPKSEDLGDAGTRLSRLELLEAKRQFAWENNLSPEETDKVFAITNNNPTKDVLNDPFVKHGLEGVRASKRVADATPSSSKAGRTFKGKSFAELSPEDQKKNYAEYVRSLVKK